MLWSVVVVDDDNDEAEEKPTKCLANSFNSSDYSDPILLYIRQYQYSIILDVA